jgi:hypothetical protein
MKINKNTIFLSTKKEVGDILKAQQEIRAGKAIFGDLRVLNK